MKGLTIRKTSANVIFRLLAALIIFALILSAPHFATSVGADSPGHYQSDYSSLSETQAAEENLVQQMADESFVLLKNKDGFLPISTSSKIVLMGRGVENVTSGGSGSGQTSTNVRISNALTNAGFASGNISSVFTNNNNGGGNGSVSASATNSVAPTMNDTRRQTIENADVAIVVFSRTSGENIWSSNDYCDQALTGVSSTHGHILALDANEKQILAYANQYCDNVILVINSCNAMELPELFDETTYPHLKAGIWVGGVGGKGYNALGRILKGEVNPSGHLTDTYVFDLTKDPTYYNWGTNTHVSGAANYQYRINGTNSGRYGQYYEEGIYLGYKYYETRAYEYDPENPITRIGEKAYANGEEWYGNTVAFPFGFGLSYTTFDWEILSSRTTSTEKPINGDSKIEVTVKVTNTGKVAGKDVVQLYYTAPYTKGGIEKAYKSLGDFEKTRLIQPGQSDVVTLHLSAREMSSYDYDDANKNGFKGYETEAGEYILHVSSDAHTAKHTLTYTMETGATYATDDRTGNPVANRFDDVSDDFNQRATEFSRSDMVGTFPVAPTTAEMTIDATYQELLNETNWTYDRSFNASASSTNANAKRFSDNREESPWYIGGANATMPKYGVTPSSGLLMLNRMTGLKYGDARWDRFIQQLTIAEMYDLIRNGGYKTSAISRLGVPQTVNQDGPQSISSGVVWVAPVNVASTWNKELCYLQGRGIGNEGMWKNCEGWYAPAVNTHRSAFGGRNFEYYSEDGVLAGKIGAEVVKGCTDKGLIVTVKHFALNEMETGRSNVAVFATEQAMREIYLRAFELPVKAGALGMMSSMNYIGTNWAGGSYALETQVLRDEWGFAGFVVTDYGAGNMDYAIRGGTDLSLNSGNPTNNNPTATQVYYMQRAAKNILYAVANSMAMNTRSSQANGYYPALAYQKPTFDYEAKQFTGMPEEEFMARVNVFSELDHEVTYAITDGALPEGLTMTADGLISGTPTKAGNYKFTVSATATDDKVTAASAMHTITITSTHMEYEAKTLATAKVGSAYSESIATAVGGNFTYSLASGSTLPAGLTLSADGTISGTPTAEGKYTFKALATDGETVLDREFELNVVAAGAKIEYSLTPAPAKVGYAYSQNIATATGATGITYEVSGTLPAGLTYANGVISGTPTTAGNYTFNIAASAPGFDAKTISVTIKVAAHDATLSYSGKALGEFAYGSAADINIGLAEGCDGITYAVKEGSELPLGLRISDGKLVGTPAAIGSFTFTLTASAQNYDTVEAEFSMTVTKGHFDYAGGKLADATVLENYAQSVAITGSVPGITYAVKEGTALPEGMKLYTSGDIARIQGAATTEGEYTFTITVKAEGYEDAEATFTLKVAAAAKEKKSGGCNGVIGGGAIAVMAVISAAAVVLLRKKED